MSDRIEELLDLLCGAIRSIDSSKIPYRSTRPPFREYAPGVGPYSETVLCSRIVEYANLHAGTAAKPAMTKRFPDLLFPDRWAIELKLARPFGDNGREAEHWSQNLLHPYPGNTSSIADAMKLMKYTGPEQPVVVVIGYEHQPARISLEPLIASFEALCRRVLDIQLGPRHDRTIEPLIHPIHQAAKMWCWSVARAR